MRVLKLLLLLFVCAAGPAVAGPWEDAVAAYDKGDHAAAFRLLRPLAEQGNGGAQRGLGDMYAKGEGVPQDFAAAVLWYRKAAEQGNAGAQFLLGSMYAIGEGVSQDFAAALPWFRKAAEQGNAGAQLGLGLMYDNGHGVRQDYVQAHMWFNLSGAQGDADAIKKRDAVAAKMTPAQIAEAQKLAREWKP